MKIFRKILILCIVVNLITMSGCKPEADSTSIVPISVSTTADTTEIKETVPTIQAINYIVNISIGKFHYPDCLSVEQMIESNKLYYSGNKKDLLEYDCSPCGNCKP